MRMDAHDLHDEEQRVILTQRMRRAAHRFERKPTLTHTRRGHTVRGLWGESRRAELVRLEAKARRLGWWDGVPAREGRQPLHGCPVLRRGEAEHTLASARQVARG